MANELEFPGSSIFELEEPKNTLFDENLSQLVEMGYTVDQAKNALETSGNSFEVALESLLSMREEEEIKERAEEDRIDMFKDMPRYDNFLYGILLYMKYKLENASNYCFICMDKHAEPSIRIRPCTKEFCEYSFEESFGAKVFPEFKNNSANVILDLSIASQALFSTRVKVGS